MKNFKFISILLACVLLVGCISETPSTTSISDNLNPSFPDSSSMSTSSSKTWQQQNKEDLEKIPLVEYTPIHNEQDLYIFTAEQPQYYKNGETIYVDKPSYIMQDNEMYISLELLFTVFDVPGYEVLKETGYWKTTQGYLQINSGGVPSKKFLDDPDQKREMEYLSYQSYERSTLSDSERKFNAYRLSCWADILRVDDEIFIPASSANLLIFGYYGNYFPNPQTLIMYSGNTPPIDVLPMLRDIPPQKNWKEVYEGIVVGTDPLGLHYYGRENPMYKNSRGYPVLYFTLYDYDDNGIPELIVLFQDYEYSEIQVFTSINGKSKFLGDVDYAAFIYDENEKLINTTYSVVDGKLIDNQNEEFYRTGNVVSFEYFESLEEAVKAYENK